MSLLGDSFFLLQKRQISEKLVQSLSELKDVLLSKRRLSYFPASSWSVNAKVHKGENYLGLPYFVLDYPSNFESKKDLITFRTMIWWGNYIHSFVLAQGKYLELVIRNVDAKQSFNQLEVFQGISSIPWSYRKDQDYVPLTTIEDWKVTSGKECQYVKLGSFFELDELNRLPKITEDVFTNLACP